MVNLIKRAPMDFERTRWWGLVIGGVTFECVGMMNYASVWLWAHFVKSSLHIACQKAKDFPTHTIRLHRTVFNECFALFRVRVLMQLLTRLLLEIWKGRALFSAFSLTSYNFPAKLTQLSWRLVCVYMHVGFSIHTYPHTRKHLVSANALGLTDVPFYPRSNARMRLHTRKRGSTGNALCTARVRRDTVSWPHLGHVTTYPTS